MSGGKVAPDAMEVEAFIARWRASEGAERASFPSFVGELCELLRAERPQPPTSDTEAVAYRFEYPVKLSGPDGTATTGRIDLYRKTCFVMEAKQSRLRGQPKEILPAGGISEEQSNAPRGRAGADRGLDVMMLNAKRQAEQYCRALPAAHGWPPFIILCDVGHCFEFYADFSGQGKNYAQFPDRHRFRVYLEDLRDPAIRAWIARVWSDPLALDPARQAAQATRQIAQRLALVSKALERRHDPEDVALFLMRCVFTMFAEDVRLIPADSFKRLLRECLEAPKSFKPLVEDLWRAMDLGRYSSAVRAELKRFNGRMFAEPQVFALGKDGIAELLAAAEHDWSLVDPAIFGTLLEQALEPAERARLGAHYTPRAYVERLVVETIIAPLRDDWRNVLAAAQQARDGGNAKAALALVDDFHGQLSRTRVLDPACGTGNFLHVAQDLMKRLEGEVLEVAAELGAAEQLGGFGARGVGPWQFFGIDANRRAVAIADLMLWIGYLQWHLRTRAFAPSEPILEELIQIVPGDALLVWDDWPVPLVEGGREITPRNPRRPGWPEVEFIVGNPPFIGGKDLRSRLGDGYVGALRAAYPQMNESADLVMYWWDRAGRIARRTSDDAAALRLRHHQLGHAIVPAPRGRAASEREEADLAAARHRRPSLDQGGQGHGSGQDRDDRRGGRSAGGTAARGDLGIRARYRPAARGRARAAGGDQLRSQHRRRRHPDHAPARERGAVLAGREAARRRLHRHAGRGRSARARQAARARRSYPPLSQWPRPDGAFARRHGNRPVRADRYPSTRALSGGVPARQAEGEGREGRKRAARRARRQ